MKMFWVSWLMLLLFAEYTLSAKIIGGSAVGGSHYMMIRNVVEELASRGHEVTLVISSAQKVKPSEKFTHKIFQVPFEAGTILETFAREVIEKGSLSWDTFQNLSEIDRISCECLLNDTGFLNTLKGFDLIIYDNIANCYVLLAEYVGIKRVEIAALSPNNPFLWKHLVPIPVSYIPLSFPGEPFTDKMTFAQRVINVIMYVCSQFMMRLLMYSNMDNIKMKYNITPERSFLEAAGTAELLLITSDFALEYPQPLLPGHIMVGPLNLKNPMLLSPELEEFVNKSVHGFIVVSFGTNVAILSKKKVELLAAAFGKLQQNVVWKLKGYIPSSLSPNIKALEWLPQNDLLGHKDVKAFVSHVGQNSLYESAYHGVPVVAVPLFGDQFYNAKKVESFGLGVTVDHNNFENLVGKIEHVINEPRFKTEAARISWLIKDRPQTPLETASDWIEYVIRHGGARHLRAQVFNTPWYQYYLLDIIAFLVAIVTLVVMVMCLACHFLCRLWCQKKDSKSKKD